jgi:hypothetical protein
VVSDVDILRRAATLMRERASAATAGPWTHGHEGLQGGEVIRGADVRVARVYKNGWPEYLPDCENAEHIASWHPGVAFLVANMLEAVADAWLVSDPDYARSLTAEVEGHRDALVVARAYLGESA